MMRPTIVALVTLLLFGCAQSERESNVIHASASDCEIIAEVGKAALLWGKQPQTALFYTDYDLPNGGTYKEDCPWHRYGVAPLLDKKTYIGQAYISRPEYNGDAATADFNFAILPKERTIAPFVSARRCTLQKTGGRWHLVGCAQGPIT